MILRICRLCRFWMLASLMPAFLLVISCANAPLERHAQVEWELRHQMPTFTPAQWNAWEAELAAALDKPEPNPPMFPDADLEPDPAGDDKTSQAGDESEAVGNRQ